MIRQRSLLVLIASAVILSGCAHQKTPIYMIERKDILPVEKDQQFMAPERGWFISDFYLSEVMDAKVEKAKREA